MALGLVLAGGGGKGAYQMGVWQAMRHLGLDRAVSVVSGTSVGALNAALFAQGDLERGLAVWRSLSPGQLLLPSTQPRSGVHLYRQLRELAPTLSAPQRQTLPALWRLGAGALLPFLSARLQSGILTNEGLRGLIDGALSFSRLSRAQTACFATCCQISPRLALRRFRLGCRDSTYDRSVLLASSALPLIFPPVELEDGRYWDGGLPVVGDNVPIAPAYQAGYRTILVVHLNQTPPPPAESFPGARLLHIIPSRSLGGRAAVLDFSPSGAQARIALGCEDGLRALRALT